MVKLENITKEYSNGKIKVKAVDSMNMEIKKGEFTVISGPSGSGKTTILNMIGAMDTPTGGTLMIEDKDISNFNSKEAALFRREKIGFIFQDFNLIPVLTAYENVEFSLDLLKKYSKEEKNKKIEEILKAVGILELKNRRPSEMSGGQQQRVAIARALVKNPALVLADEPTANLDTKTGTEILDLMKHLNESKKITFIFSSHDAKIIEYANRVIHIRDGKFEKVSE